MDERITEFGLIDPIASLAGESGRESGRVRTGIGDDASVTVPGGATVTSVDAVVDGVHFDRAWFSPEAIAGKAVAAALSDLAAMAAETGEIYVTLGVPRGTDRRFLDRLAAGFAGAAERFGAVLAGGDTVSSPTLFASVTVVGHAASESQFVLRSGAEAGQVVAVTGSLGGAAAGLWLLSQGDESGDGMDSEVAGQLTARQLDPSPRTAAGLILGGSGTSAMIDVSDGLAADLGHIAKASGVGIEIDSLLVPVQHGVPEVAATAGVEPAAFVLSGGEDFELALTIAEGDFEDARTLLAEAGMELTRVGSVVPGAGVAVFADSVRVDVPGGFDHLA